MQLQAYLNLKGLKASKFAETINAPPSTITRLLKGERTPGLSLLRRISDATEGAVTPNDFVPHASPEAAPVPTESVA